MKYSYIKIHVFSLVKAIERFRNLILGKHIQVRIHFPAMKFLLSHNLMSNKLPHWMAMIQDRDLTITTSKTIKCWDLALHLSQDIEDSQVFNNKKESISNLLFIHEEEVE